LNGTPQDYVEVALDFARIPPFHQRVFTALREVPSGRTVTYAELAALAGSPKGMRAVGQAMARNPWPIVVPCHRVLAGAGKMGGFSAYGGIATKARLLADEGVTPPRSMLDDDFDRAAALAHLRAQDPQLGAWMDRVGDFTLRPEKLHSPFAALTRSIVYQQLSGAAAGTIHGRVLAALGTRLRPEAVLAARDEDLRAAGLSRAKVLALRDLAAHTLRGTVPPHPELQRLRDAEIVERLVQVRGIGEWSVQMMLMFRLGRLDVLPTRDLGIQKGFARVQGKRALPSPEQLARFGERWRPYRSIASWYLWRALEV
jgi:methylated-DNA-[protein]-cysteine S-methyltransferase